MNESVLMIAGERVFLSNAGLYVRHEVSTGKELLAIDLWADSGESTEHFLAINGFTVADCRDVSDLQGRSFVLDGERQEGEPAGGVASGELLESVVGDPRIDPLMFESITLKFGNRHEQHITVAITASAFGSYRSGISVEGCLLAKIEGDAKSAGV